MFITDRTQLEDQLSETSQSIGFSVKVADSIKTLKQLLATDSSDLVMGMIHKFREADLKEVFPELNPSPNILVMTDEAHRTQYSLLALRPTEVLILYNNFRCYTEGGNNGESYQYSSRASCGAQSGAVASREVGSSDFSDRLAKRFRNIR